MRFTDDILNGWLNDLTAKLAGGRLSFYSGDRPSSPTSPVGAFAELVSLRLQSPAFRPAVGGRATGFLPEKVVILQSGQVTWARLSTATGEPAADLLVATPSSAEARYADVIIERADLQSGGKFSASSMVLIFPRSS